MKILAKHKLKAYLLCSLAKAARARQSESFPLAGTPVSIVNNNLNGNKRTESVSLSLFQSVKLEFWSFLRLTQLF